MKKIALLASLVAGTGVAAPAMAQTAGYAGLNYTHVDAGTAGDENVYSADFGAAFAVGGLTAMVDAGYNDNSEVWTGTGHLGVRDDKHAYGGFIGLVDGSGDTGYTVGGEYATFFDNATFAASIGYFDGPGSAGNGFGVGGEYRFFWDDNTQLNFTGNLGKFEEDETGSFGVSLEHRYANSPFSIAIGAARTDGDNFGATTVGISLRYDFGTGTLKERDRKGNTFGSLGGFGNTFGAAF